MSRKLLFGIFAHPDDEAFGPSAYLCREACSGTEVHLILVTDGAAGHNEGYGNLVETRYQEWLESGRRIGASSNYALGYADGSLNNNLYLEIAGKIIAHIESIIDSHEKVSVEFLTFEARGITGHLDHIAVSFITTYVYETLKKRRAENVEMKRLLYFCLSKKMQSSDNTNWIYWPAGVEDEAVDFVHDFSDMREHKLHVMRAHVSQKKDLEELILPYHHHEANACNKEHFLVKV